MRHLTTTKNIQKKQELRREQQRRRCCHPMKFFEAFWRGFFDFHCSHGISGRGRATPQANGLSPVVNATSISNRHLQRARKDPYASLQVWKGTSLSDSSAD